jgi:hypothetical protein
MHLQNNFSVYNMSLEMLEFIHFLVNAARVLYISTINILYDLHRSLHPFLLFPYFLHIIMRFLHFAKK